MHTTNQNQPTKPKVLTMCTDGSSSHDTEGRKTDTKGTEVQTGKTNVMKERPGFSRRATLLDQQHTGFRLVSYIPEIYTLDCANSLHRREAMYSK